MTKVRKKDCVGKFVVVIDTLCGNSVAVDENDKPDPNLYDTELDCYVDLFGDAYEMLRSHKENGTLAEYSEDVTEAEVEEMGKIVDGNDTRQMKDFLDKHPHTNYNNEFVMTALECEIDGKKLWQF